MDTRESILDSGIGVLAYIYIEYNGIHLSDTVECILDPTGMEDYARH